MKIVKQAWDSYFFGQNIGEIQFDGCEDDLPIDLMALSAGYDLVEIELAITDVAKINAVTSAGYRFVDTKIDFGKEISSMREVKDEYLKNIRLADLEDLPDLKTMISGMFRFSRYYKIPFNEKSGDLFYFEWIKNAILGKFDDVCYVYQDHEKIIGFVTCRNEAKIKSGRIGLIGVAPEFQGKEIANHLVRRSEQYFKEKRIGNIVVSTQIDNYRAVNFYFGIGFQVKDMALIFCYFQR